MKKDSFIEKKIKENARVKVVFKSDINGYTHALKGEMLDADEDFFYIENYVGDAVPINKTKIISMIFQESKDPKSEIADSVIKLQSKPKKKQKFSYQQWWKSDSVREAEE